MLYIHRFPVLGYFIFMNILGIISMAIDKRRAIRKGWRISERTLLLIALFGGSLGMFFGMYIFRHKTRHLKFVVALPILLVLHVYLLYIALYSLF